MQENITHHPERNHQHDEEALNLGALKTEACLVYAWGRCEASGTATLLPALGLMARRNGSGCTISKVYLIFGLVIEFAKKEAS